MKIICVFALFVVGISAFPKTNYRTRISELDFKNERAITDDIASAIQDVSQAIKDAGLDPLNIDTSISYALPVESLFALDLVVSELELIGLSEILLTNINYSLLTSRLTFTLEFPGMQGTLGNFGLRITFFGKQYSVSASGSLAISDISLSGNIRVSVGIITGISIRSVDMDFKLGGIESDLNVVIQDRDVSDSINTFLGSTVPNTLDEFSAEINELLEILVTQIAEQIL